MSKDLLIKNIQAYLPEKVLTNCEILVRNGKIEEIGNSLSVKERQTEVIDGKGQILLPGVIDSQVHFRDPGLVHKEDLESGSKAAALGGITTFLEMPNTKPSTTSVSAVAEKIRIAKEKSIVNYGFFIGATGDNNEELIKSQGMEGCPGIKIFLGSSTGDLLLYNPDKLKEIFRQTKVTISCHSEHEELLRERVEIRDKATTAHAHPEWRNVETAYKSTEKLLELARECGRKVHVLHVTTKEEMSLLAKNKDHCTVEVTPQHLNLFAPDCYDRLGTFAQMNPPIRSQDHQKGLWKGLSEGVVNVIGSDHAPHTKEEKEVGYPKSPSGMPGVQTLLPLMLNAVNEKKLSLDRLVELVCTGPADLFKLKTKGRIQEGLDADFTLIDLNLAHLITHHEQASKVGWTPFDSIRIKGMPTMTIVAGEVVMRNGKLTGIKAGLPIQSELT